MLRTLICRTIARASIRMHKLCLQMLHVVMRHYSVPYIADEWGSVIDDITRFRNTAFRSTHSRPGPQRAEGPSNSRDAFACRSPPDTVWIVASGAHAYQEPCEASLHVHGHQHDKLAQGTASLLCARAYCKAATSHLLIQRTPDHAFKLADATPCLCGLPLMPLKVHCSTE